MKKNTTLAPAVLAPHGIDLNAPGGVEALLEHHRLTFGDAVMQEGGAGGSGEGTGAGAGAGDGNGTGDGAGAASGTGTGDGDEPLGEGGKKALEAERTTNKQLKADLATRDAELQQLRDAGKSEEDKRSERFQQLETTEREQATAIAQQQGLIERYRVAAAKGLDLEAAERLRGTTKEELEKDADTWIAKWGNTGGAQQVPGAGARGSDRVQASPGIGTLRAGYDEKK